MSDKSNKYDSGRFRAASGNPLKLTLLFLFLACFLLSCATHTGPSFVGKLPDKAGAVDHIAADATQYILDLYPPGRTSLKLTRPASKSADPFSQAFENGLRAQGFTIAAPEAASSGAIPLSYTLDELKQDKDMPSVWYLSLRIGDQAINRVYDSTGLPQAGPSRKGGGQ